MKKIPSLFQRNYDGDRLVRPELVEGTEWVLKGEGVPTEKWDGTACMIKDSVLYRRRDRKLDKRTGEPKPAPPGWIPCEDAPNEHTGHWPGWVPVDPANPEDRWHIEAFKELIKENELPGSGTYELVGPKIQGNPYELDTHVLWKHGTARVDYSPRMGEPKELFDALFARFKKFPRLEGIVWHHPDGRMVKIKRKDFGLPWPEKVKSHANS